MRITDDIAKEIRLGIRCYKCWDNIDGKQHGDLRKCKQCEPMMPVSERRMCPICVKGRVLLGSNICVDCKIELKR